MHHSIRREDSRKTMLAAVPPEPATSPEAKKRQIHKVSAQLFAIHGYEAVGVPELCSATGLGRGAFYYHAESKDKILFEISRQYMQRLIDEGQRILAANLRPDITIERLGDAFVDMMFAERAEMIVCFREFHLLSAANQKNLRELYVTYQGIWEAAVQRGVEQSLFRPLQPLEFQALVGMYFYSFLWADTAKPTSADMLSRCFSRLVLDAIRMTALMQPR